MSAHAAMGSAEIPVTAQAPACVKDGRLHRATLQTPAAYLERLGGVAAPWQRRPRATAPAPGSQDGTYPKRHWLSIVKGTKPVAAQPLADA